MVNLAAMSGAVGRDDRKPSKRKSPGHRTGALTKLTQQNQCAPTILSAPLPRRRNCRPREGGFTAICHYRNNVIPSVCCRLPDSQPLARRRGFSHQLEFKDTVLYVASHADSSSSAGSVKPR